MSAQGLDHVLAAAVANGVLPADARALPQDTRPWPVVLLTALGAWLAALPLIGVVGMLLGDLISRSVGPYFIGVLVLAGAVVVLRSRDVPLFVEQLAVPALLVGGGALGFGLFRDLHVQVAAAALAVTALAVGALLAVPWLRVLLGAASAVLSAIALAPDVGAVVGHGDGPRFWLGWHLTLAAWLLALVVQQRVLTDGPHARVAAAIDSMAAGALLAVLAALAWWSGLTLLIGGSVGSIARELVSPAARAGHAELMQAGSVVLAGVGAWWLARDWPSVRRPWCAGVALVLLALAWFMPALGGVLLALAACAQQQRWRVAAAAGLAAAWIIGAFYYQLAWPLGIKAVVLVVAAALLAALAALAPRSPRNHTATAAARPPAPSRWGIALSALAVLAVANAGIWQKERLIAVGAPVFVELAPVDPRSLMQGDYMRLNFRLPGNTAWDFDRVLFDERPQLVGRRDARGVLTLERLDDGTPLGPDQLRIELTPKDGRWTLVTDAWFFSEGDAQRFAKAKYGEFRVDTKGHALLVGLRDAQLQPL